MKIFSDLYKVIKVEANN